MAPADFENPSVCSVCDGWKPPRAHHSQLLNRCVFRMDHACRWIDNVVGYSNQKFFILLLIYVCALAVVNSIIILSSLWTAFTLSAPWNPLHVAFLVINAVGFFISRSYLGDQLDFIESNVTLIETFQNSQGQSVGVDVFHQIFGSNPWIWPFPIHSSRSPDYSEPVFSKTSLSVSDADSLGVELHDKLE